MDPPHNPTGSSSDDSFPPIPQYKWFQTSVIDSGLIAMHSKLYNTHPPAADRTAYKELMRARKKPIQLPAHEKHMASHLFPHTRPSTMTIIVGGALPVPNDSSRSAGSRKYQVPVALLYKHTSITVLTATFDSSSSSSSSDDDGDGDEDEDDDDDTPPAYLTLPKVLPSTFQNLVDYMHSNIYSLNTHRSDYHPLQSHMRAYLLGVRIGATSFANAALRSLCKLVKPGPRWTYINGTTKRVLGEGIAAAPFRAADVAFVCEGQEASEKEDAVGKARLKSVMFDAVAAWLTISEVFGFEKEGGYPTILFDPWKSPPSATRSGTSSTPANPPPPPSSQPVNSSGSEDDNHNGDTIKSEEGEKTSKKDSSQTPSNLPYDSPLSPSQQRERALWTRLYATHDDFRARLQSSFRVPETLRGDLFRDEEDYVKGVVEWKENVAYASPMMPALQRQNAAVGERGRETSVRRRLGWLSRRGQRSRNVSSSAAAAAASSSEGDATGAGASEIASASAEEQISGRML
ncbi:hypothetical protein DM02DRAFT_618340 [Periconia macrospinosa]|uniref:BTB domain-containing protein n=1 Tax=Periconia macrospinosa TaxID=97972 RepID=A0A2V1D9R5_9PLEO|nr:hypothetical protein DM02DRAFT_618340 [Periconia macrospinosa]